MRSVRVRIVGLALSVVLLNVGTSWASSIGVQLATGGCGILSEGASGSYTCTPTEPFGPGSSSESVFVWDASFLAVHMSLSYDVSTFDGSVSNGPGAGETVTINDVLTLTSGTGGGNITFSFAVDGDLEASTWFGSFLLFNEGASGDFWTVCGPQSSTAFSMCVANTDGSVDETVQVTLSYIDGVPLPLLWQFRAGVGTGFMAAHSQADGSVDFGNTVTLQPLVITDNQGHQIVPTLFQSESGAQYQIDAPAAVPEPSALLLVATAFAAGARRLRRVKQL